MTPHQYATEVMRVISDGTVPIGMWSEYERDFILNALIAHHEHPLTAPGADRG